MSRALLIGVGNRFRGDDGAGLEVAAILNRSLEKTADFFYCDGDPIALLDLWEGRECVFLIDAVASENMPCGHLHILPLHKEAVPAHFCNTSTHFLDLLQVVELARALGRLPPLVVLYGIEAKQYGTEPSLSPALRRLLPKIAEEIERDILKLLRKWRLTPA